MAEEQDDRRALLMNDDRDALVAHLNEIAQMNAQLGQQIARMQQNIRHTAAASAALLPGALLDNLSDDDESSDEEEEEGERRRHTFDYTVDDNDEYSLIRPLLTALGTRFNVLQDIFNDLLIFTPSSDVLDNLIQTLVNYVKRNSGSGLRWHHASTIRDLMEQWKPSSRSLRHLNDNSDGGFNLLRYCCERDVSLHVIQQLIALDPNRVLYGDNNKLYLHAVCQSHGDRVDVVRHLLDLNPKAIMVEPTDSTFHLRRHRDCLPLHCACHAGNVRIVKLLHGRNPMACRIADLRGHLPLHVALSASGKKRRTNRRQEEAGEAAAAGRSTITSSPHYEIVRFLISQMPNLVRPGNSTTSGQLPLHFACLCAGSVDVVALLVATYPTSLSMADIAGRRPLDYVCMGRRRRGGGQDDDNVQQLLHYFLDQDPMAACQADHSGSYPLHKACSNSKMSVECIQLLLGQHHHHAQLRRQDAAAMEHSASAAFFVLLKRTNRGQLPLQLSRQHNLNATIQTYLAQQQDSAVRAIHQAYRDVTEQQLPFLPDLVVALIWQFAKPDTTEWQQAEEEHQNNNVARNAAAARRVEFPGLEGLGRLVAEEPAAARRVELPRLEGLGRLVAEDYNFNFERSVARRRWPRRSVLWWQGGTDGV